MVWQNLAAFTGPAPNEKPSRWTGRKDCLPRICAMPARSAAAPWFGPLLRPFKFAFSHLRRPARCRGRRGDYL